MIATHGGFDVAAQQLNLIVQIVLAICADEAGAVHVAATSPPCWTSPGLVPGVFSWLLRWPGALRRGLGPKPSGSDSRRSGSAPRSESGPRLPARQRRLPHDAAGAPGACAFP